MRNVPCPQTTPIASLRCLRLLCSTFERTLAPIWSMYRHGESCIRVVLFIALYMYSCAVAVLCSVHLWQHLYYDCPSNLTTRSAILIFCLVYVLSRFAYRGIKTIALEAALNRTRHEMQRPKHPEHWYMWISSSSRPGHHENPFNVRDPLKNLRLYFDKTLWCAGHETPSWNTLRRWRSDKLALYPQRASPVFALIFTFFFVPSAASFHCALEVFSRCSAPLQIAQVISKIQGSSAHGIHIDRLPLRRKRYRTVSALQIADICCPLVRSVCVWMLLAGCRL